MKFKWRLKAWLLFFFVIAGESKNAEDSKVARKSLGRNKKPAVLMDERRTTHRLDPGPEAVRDACICIYANQADPSELRPRVLKSSCLP